MWNEKTNPIFGQVTWERFYFRTGIAIGGACEIRQKWYPAQAKPRTYYAQGGETYEVSRHLQDPFTDLTNCYTPTHHIHRLLPTRLRLKYGQHLRIYDLETFSSRMHEQKAFIDKLADFSRGWPFSFVDARNGVVTVDLGEQLDDYNTICNKYPSVSFERVTNNTSFLSHQNTAGMLGVFGNLMTCTLAHGILMSFCVEDETQVNVAGDDGAIAEDDDNAHLIDICICAIGVYEPSKTFTTLEAGCICLKRPLSQLGTLLERKNMIIPPSIINIARLTDSGFSDPRYSWHDEDESDRSKMRILAKELTRFLRSGYYARNLLSDEEQGAIIRLCRKVTKLCQAPVEGCLPQCGGSFYWPLIPEIDEGLVTDPLWSLCAFHYTGWVRLPRTEFYELTFDKDSYRRVGHSFEYFMTNHLSYLYKLGLVTFDVEMKIYTDEEGFSELYRTFDHRRSGRLVYSFTIVDVIPEHLIF